MTAKAPQKTPKEPKPKPPPAPPPKRSESLTIDPYWTDSVDIKLAKLHAAMEMVLVGMDVTVRAARTDKEKEQRQTILQHERWFRVIIEYSDDTIDSKVELKKDHLGAIKNTCQRALKGDPA